MKEEQDYIDTECLLKLGFEETNDSLVYECANKYGTIYRMVYEGYAYVLYQIYSIDSVLIQDFRSQKEFIPFFKILSRDSLADY